MPCSESFSSLPHLNYTPGMVPDVPIKCPSNCRAFLVLSNLVKKLKDKSNVRVAVLVSSDNIQLRPLKSAKRRNSNAVNNNSAPKRPRIINGTNHHIPSPNPSVSTPRLISQLDILDKDGGNQMNQDGENRMNQVNGKAKSTPIKLTNAVNGRIDINNGNNNKSNHPFSSSADNINMAKNANDLLAKLGFAPQNHSNQSPKDLTLQRKENVRQVTNLSLSLPNGQAKEITPGVYMVGKVSNGRVSTPNMNQPQKVTLIPIQVNKPPQRASSTSNLVGHISAQVSSTSLLPEPPKEQPNQKEKEQFAAPSPIKDLNKEPVSTPEQFENEPENDFSTPLMSNSNGHITEPPIVVLDSDDDENVMDCSSKTLEPSKEKEPFAAPSPIKDLDKEPVSTPDHFENEPENDFSTPLMSNSNGTITEPPIVVLDSDDDENAMDCSSKTLEPSVSNNPVVQTPSLPSLNTTVQPEPISPNQLLPENVIASHPKISELLSMPSIIRSKNVIACHPKISELLSMPSIIRNSEPSVILPDEVQPFIFQQLTKEDCELIEFKHASLTRTLSYYQSGFPCPENLVAPALRAFQKKIPSLRFSLKPATVKFTQLSLHPHKFDENDGMLRFKFKHYGKPTRKILQLFLWIPGDTLSESPKFVMPGVSEEEELEYPVSLTASKFYFVMVRIFGEWVTHLPPIAVSFSLDSLLIVTLGKKKDQLQQQ
uniref:F-box domain-containing protein n=1 Tax=Panagrolaimus sp. JU765 TaxID=591449 RepID=A0AC34QNV5_9BILA